MRRSFRQLVLPLAAAFLAGTAMLACGADPVVAPSAASVSRTDHHEHEHERHGSRDPSDGKLVACTRREHQVGTATIGPSGGTLVVGRNKLIVPPGALTGKVLITAEVQEGNVAAVHFQPSGLVFKKPAALFLNASGCAFPDIVPDVVYFNDQGEILERIHAIYSKWWKRVIAPITHFSGYAIAV